MASSHVGRRPGTLLYVGCYTHQSPIGIAVFDASSSDGRLVWLHSVEGVEHASFLAVHPDRSVLYAVSETTSFDGRDGGGVCSFGIDPGDGSLHARERVSSHGDAPCHVSIDGAGRYLYVANYLSGTVVAYHLRPGGGIGEPAAVRAHHGSGPDPRRQQGPHAHCIVPGIDGGNSVYAADLGTDRIVHYRWSEGNGPRGGEQEPGAADDPAAGCGRSRAGSVGDRFEACSELVLEPRSGPRHLVFHPRLPVGFVVCELASTVVTVAVDPVTGELEAIGSSPLVPAGFAGSSIAADIRIDPSGHRVYASNRGHDSIAVFAFADVETPLEPLGHVDAGGRTPRNFAIHPSGRAMLVANQDSNVIVGFDLGAGSLPVPSGTGSRAGGGTGIDQVSQPVCLAFVTLERSGAPGS